MIRLTPIETKDVVIDGVTFTLRPWLGADQIAMSRADERTQVLIALRASVINWTGEGIEPFAPGLVDRLPATVMATLFAEATKMSIPSEDDVRV